MRYDCIFCAYESYGVDGLKQHSATCDLHPLAAERDELRDQLAAAQAMAEERGRALGGLHKASFDLRCVTALPFEMRVSDYQKAVEVLQHNLLTAEAALTTTPTEALDREREKATHAESRRWVDIIRRLDPKHLCDFIDELGAEEYLREWFDRAKREAAAEELVAWSEHFGAIKAIPPVNNFWLGRQESYERVSNRLSARAAELRGGK
jgi:hypothetical protein